MKTKTAFQFLKKELPLPKQITVDDADGTTCGNISVTEITNMMERYAEERLSPYLNMVIEITTDASQPCGDNIKHVRVRQKLIDKAEKLNPFL